jgi:multimeric flavodoxin WrbA
MNVIAVNSSPRGGGRSKTELMLNHLVEGMRAAGAEVDTVNLREKKIKNCTRLFHLLDQNPRPVYSQRRYDHGDLSEMAGGGSGRLRNPALFSHHE